MAETDISKLLTIQQAADKMNVSRQTIYTWINSGRIIPVHTPGGRKRIPEDQLIISQLEETETRKTDTYEIVNISKFIPVRTEQTGMKEKLWFVREDDNWHWDLEGDEFLFKVGRPGTGENWAELITCKLCDLIGLPHAEYSLAIYKGKEGVITPSFVPSGMRLILGNEIMQHIVEGYNKEQRYKQRKHTLIRVLYAIRNRLNDEDETELPVEWNNPVGIDNAVDTFIGYLLLDAWISNTDRHHENWGLIQDLATGKYHLAPTFDHASSLGSHEKDTNKLDRLTTKDYNRTVERFVERARSALYKWQTDSKPLYTIDAFLEAAMIENNAAKVWLNKLEEINMDVIGILLDLVPAEIMSETSKEFTWNVLEVNRNRLIEIESLFNELGEY